MIKKFKYILFVFFLLAQLKTAYAGSTGSEELKNSNGASATECFLMIESVGCVEKIKI